MRGEDGMGDVGLGYVRLDSLHLYCVCVCVCCCIRSILLLLLNQVGEFNQLIRTELIRRCVLALYRARERIFISVCMERGARAREERRFSIELDVSRTLTKRAKDRFHIK